MTFARKLQQVIPQRDSAPPGNDTSPPTAPGNLEATTSPSSVSLSWSASADNVGIDHYDVYRNSAKIGSTANRSYTDGGLQASTSYSYYVTASDAAGNQSAQSNTVNAITQGGNVSATKQFGVYTTGNNSGLDTQLTSMGVTTTPTLYSYYAAYVTPDMRNRVGVDGCEIQCSFGGGIDPSGSATWDDFASGKEDEYIATFVQNLDALGVPVRLALGTEPDGSLVATGQTPAQYVAAANHVFDVIHQNSTSGRVQTLMWFAGGNTATCAACLPDVTKLDHIGWDPYKTGSHPASQTPTDLFSAFIDAVITPNGYDGVKRHVNETGIHVEKFDVPTQIAFWQGVPDAMDTLGIESVVFFCANSGKHPYIPTDPDVEAAIASLVAQVDG